MSVERQDPVYSIGAVSRMLKVPAATLRAWEERYSLIKPVRSEGSQRLYSRVQLEYLRFVKTQIDSGVSAADAHRLLAEQMQRGPAPAAADRADEGQPLVLIAERDPYAADLTEHFLRIEGYAVETTLDAAEASRRFAERKPDAVIVDLLISGGSGFGLIPAFARSGKTQIVAVAAIDAADQAIHAGASAFIKKPLDPRVLVATLRDLLGTRPGAPFVSKRVGANG